VAHKKWNMTALRSLNSRAVVETFSLDNCSEGCDYCVSDWLDDGACNP